MSMNSICLFSTRQGREEKRANELASVSISGPTFVHAITRDGHSRLSFSHIWAALSSESTYARDLLLMSTSDFARCPPLLVAGRPFAMSSRADSTSPPPYSFETSSFPPPPPREGEVSRNWDIQAKFEAAKEPVRQALRKLSFFY